jgi:hypothetical protein
LPIVRSGLIRRDMSVKHQTSHAANRIQFVNHQLRQDTRYLSSCYNDIIFATLLDLLAFKKLCPTNPFRYLRRVRVTEPGLFSARQTRVGFQVLRPLHDGSVPIIKFCIENPQITVEGHVRHWEQSSTDFVPWVTFARDKMRKEATLLYEFVTCTERARRIWRVGNRKFAVCKPIPSNLVYSQKTPNSMRRFSDESIRQEIGAGIAS